MKKLFYSFLGLFLFTAFTAVVLYGCKDDDDDGDSAPSAPANTVDEVFGVEGATFNAGSPPPESGDPAEKPEINTVTGNESVIPGGSNLVKINFDDPQGDAKSIIVAAENREGYFEKSIFKRSVNIDIVITFSQEVKDSTMNILLAVVDDANNVSAYYELYITYIQVGTGQLQVSLTWDINNDIDLHLVQPDEEEIFYGNEVSSTGGELDLDSNAACDIDSVRNENITYGDTATVLAGEYIVRVDFWEECECCFGQTTNYAVNAYYNGNLIEASSGTNPFFGTFETGTATGGGQGDGVEVMRFVIPGNKSQYVYQFNYKLGNPQFKEKMENETKK